MPYNLPKSVLEEIKKGLRDLRVDSFYGEKYVELYVTRKGLREGGPDTIRFLEKHVKDYVRGVYKLRPKSLHHFVTSKKYKDNDEVHAIIDIDMLIKEGILRKVKKNGYTYWMLNGETLDPKEYVKLYKIDEETYTTIFKEYGLIDIFNRFKEEILKSRRESRHMFVYTDALVEFSYKDVKFTLYKDRIVGEKTVGYPVKEFIIYDKSAHVQHYVSNPRPEDIDRIIEYMEYTDILVKETIDNIRKIIEESTGISVERGEFSGYVRIDNYRIENISISVNKVAQRGREKIKIMIGIEHEPMYKILDTIYGGTRYNINVEMSIKSLYVYKLFSAYKHLEKLAENYSVTINTEEKEVGLSYSSVGASPLPPSFKKHFEIIRNYKKILFKLSKEILNGIEDREVIGYDKKSFYHREYKLGKVRDILDGLKWGTENSFDEIIFKLIVLKFAFSNFDSVEPPLLDYLIGQTVLRGHSQDLISEKINNPLDTLIEYASKGLLKTWKRNGKQIILFKNKPLKEYIDEEKLPHEASTLLRRAVNTAILLVQKPIDRPIRAKRVAPIG